MTTYSTLQKYLRENCCREENAQIYLGIKRIGKEGYQLVYTEQNPHTTEEITGKSIICVNEDCNDKGPMMYYSFRGIENLENLAKHGRRTGKAIIEILEDEIDDFIIDTQTGLIKPGRDNHSADHNYVNTPENLGIDLAESLGSIYK